MVMGRLPMFLQEAAHAENLTYAEIHELLERGGQTWTFSRLCNLYH